MGAEPRAVLRMVLSETLLLAGTGVAVGMVAASAMTRLIAALLYGLSANDPPTIAFPALLMPAVSTLAGWISARRAAKVKPLEALHHQ